MEYALAGGGAHKQIASFPDSVEADMVAMVLESQGIRAKVVELPPTGAWVARVGMLIVREADAGRAIELLASTPARKRLTIPESDLPPAKVMKVETCPKCDSTEVAAAGVAMRIILGGIMLAWLPVVFWAEYGWAIFAGLLGGWLTLTLQTQKWRCRACGYRWRPARR